MSDEKLPFDIDEVMQRVADAVEPYPKAVLFELAEEGYKSPFEQLIACIVTIRTREEASGPVIRRLFKRAHTPSEVAALSRDELADLLSGSAFSDTKAANIYEIAHRILSDHAGETPCDFDSLTAFPGVGPKCANLVLGIACGKSRIGVDIHVHRVTNRWSYVSTNTPEQTTTALEEKLPRRYWLDINRLLVPFGKHICTGKLPRCSECPVLDWCRQVGVGEHR